MVCGFNFFYDKPRKRYVTGFVASVNGSFSRYYSSVEFVKKYDDIPSTLKAHMTKALK